MEKQDTIQDTIDDRNRAFWNEPCGSNAFKAIGIEGYSTESLKKYDDWYMGSYPYLYTHVPFAEMNGKKVLEVGLGMGTISQKLAEAGALYHGLDIAVKPVDLVNARLAQNGLEGRASVGSILNSGISDATYDFVVAIGCYHHTGNLQKAIDETWRILKPGGKAVIMIYNAYSYRQWLARPVETGKRWLGEFLGTVSKHPLQEDEDIRRMYDVSTNGEAPAETVLTSKKQFRRMSVKFRSVRVCGENVEAIHVFRSFGREKACRIFGNMLGLDLYCTCVK